jgi:hypothetical protein
MSGELFRLSSKWRKRSSAKLGWRLDADFPFDNGFRVVQFTPRGSGCSVQFGTKMTTAAPGSAQGLYLVVSDVEAARKELVAQDIGVSEVFHTSTPGAQFRPESNGRVSGPAPDHRSYSSFATFNDPDGNTWLFQGITTHLPGRGLSNLDVATLTDLCVRRNSIMASTNQPRRSTIRLGGTQPTLPRAKTARHPKRQPQLPSST